MEQGTFKYRIVKTTYRNRITFEDGPGSTENISSNKKESIGKEFIEDERIDVKKEFGRGIRISNDGGWTEYSYKLELFNEETQEWEYDQYIPTYEEDGDGDDYH